MKKLFSKIGKLFKKQSPFQVHENGKRVFYPWGSIEEGIILAKRDARKAAYLYWAFFLILMPTGVFSPDILYEFGLINIYTYGHWVFFAVTFITPIYFSMVLYIKRKGTVSLDKVSARFSWIRIAFLSYVVLLYAVLLHNYYLIFFVSSFSIVSVAIYSFGAIFSIHFYVRLVVRRGCYFSK